MSKSAIWCPSPIIPICIICEGYEEYDYLTKLSAIGAWRSDIYDVQLINAKSISNISVRYQDRYMSNAYYMIFIFCDTDLAPYSDFLKLKEKINKFHGSKNIADEVVIFGNPCTMQIMLLHFADVMLTSKSKSKNAAVIEKLTGIKNYGGHDNQRAVFMKQLTKDNLANMVERVETLPKDVTQKGSSNFSVLLLYLNSESTKWIKELNDGM